MQPKDAHLRRSSSASWPAAIAAPIAGTATANATQYPGTATCLHATSPRAASTTGSTRSTSTGAPTARSPVPERSSARTPNEMTTFVETVPGQITDTINDGTDEITVEGVRPSGLYTYSWSVTTHRQRRHRHERRHRLPTLRPRTGPASPLPIRSRARCSTRNPRSHSTRRLRPQGSNHGDVTGPTLAASPRSSPRSAPTAPQAPKRPNTDQGPSRNIGRGSCPTAPSSTTTSATGSATSE